MTNYTTIYTHCGKAFTALDTYTTHNTGDGLRL